MMLAVDIRSLWMLGRSEFALWFVFSSLVLNFLLIRKVTPLSLVMSVAADIAITAVSWVVVVALPVSIFAWAVVHDLFFSGQSDHPISWILIPVMSALIAAGAGFTVLLAFNQKIARSVFGLLVIANLVSIGLAVYRMWTYVAEHPPEA